jgi:hypothetical protein
MADGDSSGGGAVEEGREGREAADLGFASRAACGRDDAGGLSRDFDLEIWSCFPVLTFPPSHSSSQVDVVFFSLSASFFFALRF